MIKPSVQFFFWWQHRYDVHRYRRFMPIFAGKKTQTSLQMTYAVDGPMLASQSQSTER